MYEKNHTSVLLLTTGWLFDFTNITSVTRSIVNTLRFHDPSGTKIKITCAVLALDGNIEQIQIDDANTENVRLKGAKLPQGEKNTTPEIRWIDQLSASYYQHLLDKNSFNFIIGHAPLLAYGAANLADICKRQSSPKVVLMVHTLPKTEKGLLDKSLLCTWLERTDIVYSVGETDSNVLKRFVHGKMHGIYIPIYPLKPSRNFPELESTMVVESGKTTPKITVVAGRKELGYKGIDAELVVEAVGYAVKRTFPDNSRIEVNLTFIGEELADESDLKTCFHETLQRHNMCQDLLTFHFLTSDESKGSKGIPTCMLDSTLVMLPLRKNYSVFGLEALTAAWAGIPILVSENSGVGALLRDMGKDRHSVVRQRRDFDSNVRAWAEHISEKISKQSEARDEANRLRESLLKSTHIGTTHLKFISPIIRKF